MKTKQLIAVLALTAATGAAFAQTVSTTGESLSPKTRAQVVTELQQAKAQGQLQSNEASYPVLTNTVLANDTASGANRAQMAANDKKTDRNGTTNSSLYSGA